MGRMRPHDEVVHKLLALAGDVRTGFRALGSPNAQAKEHLLQPEAADLHECDEKEDVPGTTVSTESCCLGSAGALAPTPHAPPLRRYIQSWDGAAGQLRALKTMLPGLGVLAG